MGITHKELHMSTSLANTFSSKYGALGFLAIFLANPVSAGPNDAVDDDGMILNARDAAAIAVNADKGVVGKQEPYIGSIGSELGQGEDLSEGNAEFTFRNGVLPADILAEEEEAVPAPILGRYRAKNPSPESVIGGNQGRQWLKTTVYPTRAVVYIYFNGGYSCTGWMIGPNTVATAGHCVNKGAGQGWYPTSSYRIYPGRDGSSAPYGYCTAKGLYSNIGWTVSGNHEYDYGAIKLNCTVGNTTGWFGFKYKTTSLLNEPTIVQGYPGDNASATHWVGADKNRCDAPRKIYYKSDSYGGMSGGPIWNDVTLGSGAVAMGIHAYGNKWGSGCNYTYNSGTRITSAVYNNLVYWKNLP